MNIDKYQEFTDTVAMPTARTIDYLYPGLMGEVGEFMSLEAKTFRDGFEDYTYHTDVYEHEENLKKELGDIMWFVCMIANAYEFKMSDILKMNKNKLKDRQKRGVIGGSGDDR